jgi:hypothetical protein
LTARRCSGTNIDIENCESGRGAFQEGSAAGLFCLRLFAGLSFMTSTKKQNGTGKALVPTVTAGRVSAGRLRVQRLAERPERWTATKETAFLAVLSMTANVRHSLRTVGMSAPSLYHRRRTRAAFEAAWDKALSEGYARLEAEMLARALGQSDIGDPADAPAGPAMTDAIRMALLNVHEKRVAQYRARMASEAQIDPAKLRREITERLDRLARSLGIEVRR